MKKLLFSTYLIILITSLGQNLFAQYVKTAAGTGTAGYSGDGGLAQSATLSAPYGVAVDGSGNIFIADEANNVIRRVDGSTGVITTYAGTGTAGYSGDGAAATTARIYAPSSVAIDNSGNLYFSDQLNHRVRMVNATTRIITTVAGNGTGAFGGDGGAATSANLQRPYGLAFDAAGDLYIADRSNNRIRKVTLSTGIITTVAGSGTVGYNGDGISALTANLNRPLAIAFGPTGDLYFVDNGNNRVRMVNGSGTISTVAGNGSAAYTGDGGTATAATLNSPSGMVFDGSGNLYIADMANNAIRVVNTSGNISTAAGTGTAGFNGDCVSPASAQLNQPSFVIFDATGNLTICDKDNNRIRKIIQPCAGTPTAGSAIASVVDGCPYYGSTLSLAGTSLSCDYAYQWQSSADGISFTAVSGATSSSYFLAPGASTYYRAIVTCTNTGLADTSSAVYLNVNALPVIGPITGPTAVCIGDTIALTNSFTSGTWFATNTNATINASGDVVGLVAGLDTIVYYASNFCGTVYDSSVITVNPIVTPYIAVTAFPGTSVCDGTSVVYSATTLFGGATPTILWTVNGVYSGTGATFTYTPTDGDVIMGTLYTSAPCATVSTASSSVTMFVTNLLTPSAYISNGLLGDSVCSGYPVTFYGNIVNGGTSPSFTWAVNGTVLGSGASFTYTPSNGDILSLVGTSSFTCATPASAYDTTVITVDLTQDPAVSITANPGDTSCTGYVVTYTAFWRYGGLTPNLLWKKNGIAVATGPNYSFTPVTGDYVQCVLYSSSPCRTADSAFSNIINMYVGSFVTAFVNVTATPGTTITAGQEDTLTANVTNGGSNPKYQWYLNGALVPGATNSTYISNAFVNNDSVYCSVIGSYVCALPYVFRSNSLVITVAPPNRIATLHGGSNLKLAPNPNAGSFQLSGVVAGGTGVAEIKILNLLGTVVYHAEAKLNDQKMNHEVKLADELASGMYLIQITSGGVNEVVRFNLQK